MPTVRIRVFRDVSLVGIVQGGMEVTTTVASHRAVQSVNKCPDSDSFIKAQYVLITVNL
jgi:hypothetical protein